MSASAETDVKKPGVAIGEEQKAEISDVISTADISPAKDAEGVHGIVIDGKNRVLYFSAEHVVKKWSLEDKKLLATYGDAAVEEAGKADKTKFGEPRGLAFDPSDESLVIADVSNKKVWRISKDNKISSVSTTDVPYGVSCDKSGNIFVIEVKGGKGAVTKIAKKDNVIEVILAVDNDLTNPQSIAVDPSKDTDLYVLTRTAIYKVDTVAKTKAAIKLPDELAAAKVEAFCLTVDAEGLPVVSSKPSDVLAMYKVIQKSGPKAAAGITRLTAKNDQDVAQKWQPAVVAVDQSTDEIYFADQEKNAIRKLAGNRACRMCGTSCTVM